MSRININESFGKERFLMIGNNVSIRYKDGENGMLLLMGTPGCGKSWNVITRQVVDNSGESMVIDDKKGSILKATKEVLLLQGYKVCELDLKDYKGDFKYNIFEHIESEADIRKIVSFFLPDQLRGNDPFWLNSARLLLQGLIGIAIEEERFHKRTLNIEKLFKYLGMMDVNVDPRTGQRLENEMDKLIMEQQLRGINIPSHRKYTSVRDSADDTFRSVLIEIRASLAYLDDKQIFKITNYTNIDINELGKSKVALFVISSDTDLSLDPFVKLIYRQITDALFLQADRSANNMLDNHVRFILDDFASGTSMDGFAAIIANARSRNIAYEICIQSMAQLNSLYGSAAAGILDCINYKVYFPSANFETQKYLSELLDKPVYDIQKLPANKICLEQIHDAPRIIDRFEGTQELLNSLRMKRTDRMK